MTIKEMRELLEMTQAEFSTFYGIPKRTIENWEGGANKCPDYVKNLLERCVKEDKARMRYLVEFGEGENFTAVDEWQTLDDLQAVQADTVEDAAMIGANTDGLEDMMFKVTAVMLDNDGIIDKVGKPQYFDFK